MRPIPVDDPETFDVRAAFALEAAGWFARLKTVPHWPVSERHAVQILRVGGEYDIDAPRLAELIRREIISAPDDGCWQAGDIVQAGAMLEARRQWVMTPSYHDPKKHAGLLAFEQARTSDSLAEQLDRSPRLDVRHLLVLLAECDNREAREKLAAQLLAELEHVHGVRL